MNGNLIVKNASQLVTCSGFSAKKGRAMNDLSIIEDGAVVITDGKISAVGKTREILGKYSEAACTVIDADGKAVLPGFIDSHTHFIFGGYREEEYAWRLSGQSYMEIMAKGGGIFSTVNATRKADAEYLRESGRARLDSMLSFGVTTVEGKSGYGLDLTTELRQLRVMAELDREHPVDIKRTFLGAHAVPPEYREDPDRFIDFIIETVLPEVVKENLADFCDIFCEKNVFSVDQSRRLLTAAKKMGLAAKIHADEIVCLGGAELAAELGAVSADHLLQASDTGLKNMAEKDVVATLLPCTAFSLKEPYADGSKMIDMGCAVALASDMNPGSSYTESIPLIFALATREMGLSTEEAITALTINGAAALGIAGTTGSIDIGKKGDLVILEFPSYRHIPYHIGVSTVEKVVKNGELVFDKKGDAYASRFKYQ